MRSVIINADDFGLTDGVSRAIVEALESDIVSGTTVMTCAPGAELHVRRWIDTIRPAAGVHLQLTGGWPRLPPTEVPSLCSDDGSFLPRNSQGSVDVHEVAAEWNAQMEAAIAWGLRPTHLDTHHDVHADPRILGVYLSLARARGLPVRGLTESVAIRMEERGVQGATRLVRRWSGRSSGLPELLAELEEALGSPSHASRAELLEIVSHPGYPDDELARLSSVTTGRLSDLTILQELAASRHLEELGLRRISYSDLH